MDDLNRKKRKWIFGLSLILIGILIGGGLLFAKSNGLASKREAKAVSSLPQGGIVLESYVGRPAPDFSLPGIDGGIVSLKDYRGKAVVLFFNEGSMCYPSCWKQIAELSQDARLNNEEVAAFSIVVDRRGDWEKIVKNAPQMGGSKILFDAEKDVSEAYGALSLDSSMHKGLYPGHTFFVIDKEGIIRYGLDDPMMAIRNDQIASEIAKII